MVKVNTAPCGTLSFAVICGAAACVGPMMKLPSTFADGTAPSGNSVALTYPAECGSRVGGVGRAAGAGIWTGVAAGAGLLAACVPPPHAESASAPPMMKPDRAGLMSTPALVWLDNSASRRPLRDRWSVIPPAVWLRPGRFDECTEYGDARGFIERPAKDVRAEHDWNSSARASDTLQLRTSTRMEH